MKYILLPLLLFLIWKVYRDWYQVRRAKRQLQARVAAELAFERWIFTLESQLANGKIDEAQFKLLREEAYLRLQQTLRDAS
ncbi:MAG: hypothetical protein Q4A74_06795 [Cardiobacteriaceae bacterium]|nr:hypothetical protein [Cardiobacteriaceae bacterium]